MSKNKTLAMEWFKIASEDLEYAKLGLREDKFYAMVAFHAQQSAEKFLKGFILLNNKKLNRSHDLVMLIKTCQEIDKKFVDIKEEAGYLTPFAIDVRYPVFYPIIEKKMAEKAVEMAENIKKFIINKYEN
jgi:HEPN domain-containing protein